MLFLLILLLAARVAWADVGEGDSIDFTLNTTGVPPAVGGVGAADSVDFALNTTGVSSSVGGVASADSGDFTLNTDFYANDGIPDDWQIQHFGPNNPNGIATADPDGDGQDNLFEYYAGTDPNDPNSRFFLTIANVSNQPTRKLLTFGPRLPGRAYAVQFRPDVAAGTFSNLMTTLQSDVGTTRMVTDSNATGSARFYRVSITSIPAPLGANLIVNSDAEAGPGSLTGDDVFPVPGWITSGDFTVAVYGNSSSVPVGVPGPANRGVNYFSGAPSTAVSVAIQPIDVTAASAAIDSAGLAAELSGYLGGWQFQDDNAVLVAKFLDRDGSRLGQLVIGPVLASERSSATALLFRSATNAVPVGTRQVRLVLTMTRTEGTYNNGIADNLSFVIRSNAVSGAARIAYPPLDQWVATGSNATFHVFATGTAPLAYQWLFYGTNLPGSTDSTLVINNASAANAGNYAVRVTNASGQALSSDAVLHVASAQSLLNTNLIVNNGAELGPTSITGNDVVVVPGWTTTNNFTVALYGDASNLPTNVPGPPNRGTNYFAGGPNTSGSTASQTIQLGALSAAIDAGQVSAELAGYLGGYATQNDNAALAASFLDTAGDSIGQLSIGPVTAADRTNITSFLFRGATNSVPTGTRAIQLTLMMTRITTPGTYNDGLADNLSLVLRSVVP